MEPDGTTVVNENGQTDTVTIVLDVEPVSDVAVTLASGDRDQASLSATRLVFTPANWNVPQVVTVSAPDNAWLDGDQTVDFGGVEVIVDDMSVPYLDGATIDFKDTISEQGFTIDNPNAAGSCACGDSFH